MRITIDIYEDELENLDLTDRQLEELVWENLNDVTDPGDLLEKEVVINIYR